MFSIVYSSVATSELTSIDIAELVTECRVKNRKVGVTGMLMSEDDKFLQVLEGPEYLVRDLMSLIERDPRHDQVKVLAEEQITTRRFPDWSMGYGRVGDIEAAPLADYGDALAAERRAQPESASRLQQLAGWFRGR